jgi:hypothetical protein
MTGNTSTPGRLPGLREILGAQGLRPVSDTDGWIDSRDEGFLKLTVGPDGQLGASVIPGRPSAR